MAVCLYCSAELVRQVTGRSPVYCSNACKMSAYRRRNVTSLPLRNIDQKNAITLALRNIDQQNVTDIKLLNDEQPKFLSEILESARAFGSPYCLSCSKPFRSDSLSYVIAQRLKIPNRAFILFCHSGCSSKFYSELNESLRIAGSFSEVA